MKFVELFVKLIRIIPVIFVRRDWQCNIVFLQDPKEYVPFKMPGEQIDYLKSSMITVNCTNVTVPPNFALFKLLPQYSSRFMPLSLMKLASELQVSWLATS